MNLFLKAKHWQIFVLFFALPMVIHFANMAYMFSSFDPYSFKQNLDPFQIFGYMKISFISITAAMILQYTWYWSVGIGLKNRLPQTVKMKTGLFKFFVLYPPVYLILFFVILTRFFFKIQSGNFEMNESSFPVGIAVGFLLIIPFHFFAVFCVFFSFYFIAKTIKSIELQREVSFSDFAGEFFLIWFFPIGVWFIQPRINKIIETENTI